MIARRRVLASQLKSVKYLVILPVGERKMSAALWSKSLRVVFQRNP